MAIRKDWRSFTASNSSILTELATQQQQVQGQPIDVLFSWSVARGIEKGNQLQGGEYLRLIKMRSGRQAYLSAIDAVLKSRGIHYDSFIAAELDRKWSGHAGTQIVQAWRENFKLQGRLEYADWLLQAVRVHDDADIARGLRLNELQGTPFQQVCLLGNLGSDLKLKGLMGQHSRLANEVMVLQEVVSQNRLMPIVLLIDQIHSGSQLIRAIERLPKAAHSRSISIRPYITTERGAKKVRACLAEQSLHWILDTTSSEVLPCHSSLGTELAYRLSEMAYSEAQIRAMQTFCQNLGADLVGCAIESHKEGGLGHDGLGLVSMIDWSPGKSVLPVLRLGRRPGDHEFDYPVKLPNGRFEPWAALIPYRNSSGAG